MNILLTTALMVASGPLASTAVANQVLSSGHAPARSLGKDSIIDTTTNKKLAAERSPPVI
jgi:hypothetical protein